MAKRTKLTNNSDESEISELFAGDSIFFIPYFQRPYKWKSENLRRLEDDALNIVDESTDSHFLGAIIIHGRRANPSDPTIFDVIDGQQRITTIYLYICATIRVLCQKGQIDEAVALFQKYIALGRQPKGLSNIKLQSCKEDRKQLNYVMSDLLSNIEFREKLGSFAPKLLPPTGHDKSALRNNYRAAVRFFEEQFKQGGLERVQQVYKAFLDDMSVVQIDVWDPTNRPKIFDSLNSRQEPMTIGDLVRNEIFSKVAKESHEDIDLIDEVYWQPFYKNFQTKEGNLFDKYFFPYGLIQNPNRAKSEVYGFLRDSWEKTIDPTVIIEGVATYQNAFIDLMTGQNTQAHPKDVMKSLSRLHRMGLPTSTLPFLMALSNAIKVGQVNFLAGTEILGIIESFLVRRAVCGIEPTGLHAVFKRLWHDCSGDVNSDRVVSVIQSHKTVAWPSDEEFSAAIRNREIYGSTIANYFIREYDASLGGDSPKDLPWIEHILPQTMSEEWKNTFSEEQHQKLVNVVGNLIPLSSEMNMQLRNSSYEIKIKVYGADSMFKSARDIQHLYSNWTPDEIQHRTENIVTWALSRWRK